MAVGPIKHRGQPVQFGSEKEFNLKTLKGDKAHLDHAEPGRYEPGLMGNVTAEMLRPESRGKVGGQVAWADLNDQGRAHYALQYKAQHGKFPPMRAVPNGDYAKIDFEKNGWIEVITPVLELDKLQSFLNDYGWGHIHTTWMRGAPAEEQRQQVSWVQNANLYSFLNSMEARGASGNGEEGWRFSIMGLSMPTEEHLDRYAQILNGKNMVAIPFNKHLIVNLRGNGKSYGSRDRVGIETRGGTSDEKRRIINSLLNGLENGQWGTTPAARGADAFRLPKLGADARGKDGGNYLFQVKSLPSDFRTQIQNHLRQHPIEGMSDADATRMFNFVNNATFYEAETAARLQKFDQRAVIPLLNYEAIGWLPEGDKARAVTARGNFIRKLGDLEKRGLAPREAAVAISNLMADWAKEAKLASAFGAWLDGPNGEQKRLN